MPLLPADLTISQFLFGGPNLIVNLSLLTNECLQIVDAPFEKRVPRGFPFFDLLVPIDHAFIEV